MDVVKRSLTDQGNKAISPEEYVRLKKRWEAELEGVRSKLNASQRVRAKSTLLNGAIIRPMIRLVTPPGS